MLLLLPLPLLPNTTRPPPPFRTNKRNDDDANDDDDEDDDNMDEKEDTNNLGGCWEVKIIMIFKSSRTTIRNKLELLLLGFINRFL